MKWTRRRFNPNTLRVEQVPLTRKEILRGVAVRAMWVLAIGASSVWLFDQVFQSPADRARDREIAFLEGQLTEMRDELTAKVVELGKQAGEKGEALLAEQKISESARAQVALMNRQLAALRQQLATLEATLRAAEEKAQAQGVQIETLGKRLNAALASKVQELSRYRSEFFGKLREVLGNRPGIRIVGDRFVFQSEVLFDVGSAELGPAGKEQMLSLAKTLLDLSARIPQDIDWVLRVDGHTDKTPIHTARFPSNWELSTARAISVVKFLAEQGLPPVRLVAAGFADNRPIDSGNDEIALRRNRRIELKLTQR